MQPLSENWREWPPEAKEIYLKRLKEQTGCNSVIQWRPNEGAQTKAYYSLADELFYGGAAGGGKTDLVLGLAGTAHHRSLILRRTFPLLRGIIDRSREIYNWKGSTRSQDSYNEATHIWRLPAWDRQVEFGAIQLEKNRENYRGRPHDLKAWDELPQFLESQFRFVNGWNRSTYRDPKTGKLQRCRVVATGNPPTTPEGRWIVTYWAPWLDRKHPRPAAPGELRWFAVVDGQDVELDHYEVIVEKGKTILPHSRTFIPARLSDTPQLMETDYETRLHGLPEPLRSQMLYGDFSIGIEDHVWQIIPTEWVQAAIERGRELLREGGRPRTLEGERLALVSLGCDVARGGADSTVIATLYENCVGHLLAYPGRETRNGEQVATLVINAWDGKAAIGIDVIAIGASPYDVLDGQGIPVQGIDGGSASRETDRTGLFKFANLRAEGWWKLREALDPDGDIRLALPDDPELLTDLTAPRYTVRMGRIQVESKDDIIARIHRSPDRGDAVVYAYQAARDQGKHFGFEAT